MSNLAAVAEFVCVFCSLLNTSSSGAFDNKLRRTMTSPYISTTTDIDSNRRSVPPFSFTVVILFCCFLLWVYLRVNILYNV